MVSGTGAKATQKTEPHKENTWLHWQWKKCTKLAKDKPPQTGKGRDSGQPHTTERTVSLEDGRPAENWAWDPVLRICPKGTRRRTRRAHPHGCTDFNGEHGKWPRCPLKEDGQMKWHGIGCRRLSSLKRWNRVVCVNTKRSAKVLWEKGVTMCLHLITFLPLKS